MAKSNAGKVIAGVVIGTLAVVGVAALVVIGYTGYSQSKCFHEYDEGRVRVEATCDEAGEIVYGCENCGKTKTEEIKKLPHTYVDGECTECGAEEQVEDSTISEDSALESDSTSEAGSDSTEESAE